MEFRTDYRTEQYALQTAWEDFPERVRLRAVDCSIDLMGALILGSQSAQFRTGLKLASGLGLAGDIPVIGAPGKYNLAGAAIAMGHSSNAFDIDDGYNMVKGHPGTSFIAGLLAASLQKKASRWQRILSVTAEQLRRNGQAMQTECTRTW